MQHRQEKTVPADWTRRWLPLALLSMIAGAAVLAVVLERPAPLPAPVAAAMAAPEPAAATAAPQIGWTAVDAEIVLALETARTATLAEAERAIGAMIDAMQTRVRADFVPWYLAFGRRKLEELEAYNHFALDKLHTVTTGRWRDSSTPALVATFEQGFHERVLDRDATRKALRDFGHHGIETFARVLATELRGIQRRYDIGFAEWTAHLRGLRPLAVPDGRGGMLSLSPAMLAEPDPTWLVLGEMIAERLMERFDRLPSVVHNVDKLATADGVNIFMVGENAVVYFGSYIVYWVGLIALVRFGIVPMSLFGALIGWVIWEIFAWGSWIALEAADFERVRQELEPLLATHLETYLDHARAPMTDIGANGPFRIVHDLAAWRP